MRKSVDGYVQAFLRLIISVITGLWVVFSAASAQEGAVPGSGPDDFVADGGPVQLIQAARPQPVGGSIVCPFRGRIDYDRSLVDCGVIYVPENRADPDSRLIRLVYTRLGATTEDTSLRREDPIIFLTGGPGGPLIGSAQALMDHPVREFRDLYILEQRGIAYSDRLCPFFGLIGRPATTALDLDAEAEEVTRRMAQCFAEAAAAGVDLSAYNTYENARDVRALREALGFDAWNVWGISYGSHLGQALLREDPDGVRTIVLDGIVPADLRNLQQISRNMDLVVDNFIRNCNGADACERLLPRFLDTMRDMQREPVTVEINDPEFAPSGEVWIPPYTVAFLPFLMAYSEETYAYIPAVTDALIRAVETRDEEVLEAAGRFFIGGSLIEGGDGMSVAFQCNDGYFQERMVEVPRETRMFPEYAGLWDTPTTAARYVNICEAFGMPAQPLPSGMMIDTDVPTLIANGAWDPITPPYLADQLAAAMPSAAYVIVPYAGHGPTYSLKQCAAGVMTELFDTLDAASLDVECMAKGQPEPVFVDVLRTNAAARAANLAASGSGAILVPILWVGLSLLTLFNGFLAIASGFISRLFDRANVSALGAGPGFVRLIAFLTAALGLVGFGLIVAGAMMSAEVSFLVLLAGFAAPAKIGAWLVLAAALVGAIGIVLQWRAAAAGLTWRIGTRFGLPLIGIAAIALAVFIAVWGILPF